MTNLAVSAGAAAATALKFQNGEYDKGSVENTAGHAIKQTENSLKGLTKDAFILTAGTAATAGTTTVVSKSKTAQNIVQKGIEFIKDKFNPKLLTATKVIDADTLEEVVVYSQKEGIFAKLLKKAVPLVKKATTSFNAMPKSAKIVAAAGAAITALLIHANSKKTAYESGKISQEYTDKQKISQIL